MAAARSSCWLLAALLGVAAAAQQQACSAKQPGAVPAITLSSTSLQSKGGASGMTITWPRPKDGSCVDEYTVDVHRAGDAAKAQPTAIVRAPQGHTGGSFTASGLQPGASYEFTVVARAPKLGAAGTGPGLRSPAFTAAPASVPACRQPSAVSNIRRTKAKNDGAMSLMTVAWDAPPTPAECFKEYVVIIYHAGTNNVFKSLTVNAPRQDFTENYPAGKSFEVYIYARNPVAGALGNGVGLRSAPIVSPTA